MCSVLPCALKDLDLGDEDWHLAVDDSLPLPPAVVAALHAATSPAPTPGALRTISGLASPTGHFGPSGNQPALAPAPAAHAQPLYTHMHMPPLFVARSQSLSQAQAQALAQGPSSPGGAGAGGMSRLSSAPSGGLPGGGLLATMASIAASPRAGSGSGSLNGAAHGSAAAAAAAAAAGLQSSLRGMQLSDSLLQGGSGGLTGGVGSGGVPLNPTGAAAMGYSYSPRAASGASGALAGQDAALLACMGVGMGVGASMHAGRPLSDQAMLARMQMSGLGMGMSPTAMLRMQQQERYASGSGALGAPAPGGAAAHTHSSRAAAPSMASGRAPEVGEADGAVAVHCRGMQGWYLMRHGVIACACAACSGNHGTRQAEAPAPGQAPAAAAADDTPMADVQEVQGEVQGAAAGDAMMDAHAHAAAPEAGSDAVVSSGGGGGGGGAAECAMTHAPPAPAPAPAPAAGVEAEPAPAAGVLQEIVPPSEAGSTLAGAGPGQAATRHAEDHGTHHHDAAVATTTPAAAAAAAAGHAVEAPATTEVAPAPADTAPATAGLAGMWRCWSVAGWEAHAGGRGTGAAVLVWTGGDEGSGDAPQSLAAYLLDSFGMPLPTMPRQVSTLMHGALHMHAWACLPLPHHSPTAGLAQPRRALPHPAGCSCSRPLAVCALSSTCNPAAIGLPCRACMRVQEEEDGQLRACVLAAAEVVRCIRWPPTLLLPMPMPGQAAAATRVSAPSSPHAPHGSGRGAKRAAADSTTGVPAAMDEHDAEAVRASKRQAFEVAGTRGAAAPASPRQAQTQMQAQAAAAGATAGQAGAAAAAGRSMLLDGSPFPYRIRGDKYTVLRASEPPGFEILMVLPGFTVSE